MATIKELFQQMEISDKERLALEATLRGADLEELFTTMDNIVDILRPLYEKNLSALGVDYGSPEGDKTIITRVEPCPMCYGSGYLEENYVQSGNKRITTSGSGTCPQCNGSGEIRFTEEVARK